MLRLGVHVSKYTDNIKEAETIAAKVYSLQQQQTIIDNASWKYECVINFVHTGGRFKQEIINLGKKKKIQFGFQNKTKQKNPVR